MNTATANKKITANNIVMAYEDTGLSGGDTTPILFIHGFPLDKSYWRSQLDYFRQSNRAIAYDIRGYGDSGNNSEKPSIALFADDLIEFMNEMKIDRAVVCCISMGGYIAMKAVQQHPERFTALVLCDTQCAADTIEARDKRHLAIQQIEAGGIQDFANGFVKKAFSENYRQQNKEEVEKLRLKIISTSPRILTGTLTALLQREELCGSLKNIQIPVQIICGKEDTMILPAQSENMKRLLPDATLTMVDKAGHFPNLEQPSEFNKQMSKFISNLSKS